MLELSRGPKIGSCWHVFFILMTRSATSARDFEVELLTFRVALVNMRSSISPRVAADTR
jgi:hypothetical protein